MANRALIVANGAFADSTIPTLSSPVSDGRKLKALLERDDVGSYVVDLCENGSSVDVRHAIQEFFDAGKPEDMQLLVISSHGLKDRWSRLYFATADTSKSKVAASSLEPRFISERMDDSSAGRKILIIDACYSGAFLEGMVYKKGDESSISREDFGGSSAGGTTIITASSKVQMAGENDIDGSMQSVFTRCMIEGIETGAADASGDGLITLSELYDYVSRRLKAEAPGQTPQWLDMSHGGPIVIARNPIFRKAALPDDLVGHLKSRDRALRIAAVEDLEELAGGRGSEMELALDALKSLAMDDSSAVRQLARDALDRLRPAPLPSPPRPEMHILLYYREIFLRVLRNFFREPKTIGRIGIVVISVIFAVYAITAYKNGNLMFQNLKPSEKYTKDTIEIDQPKLAISPVETAKNPNSVKWLVKDWVINQAELGCTSRMAIKLASESRIEVSINGKAKEYDFTSAENGGLVKTDVFTFRRNGNKVEVSGEQTNFKLSQCAG